MYSDDESVADELILRAPFVGSDPEADDEDDHQEANEFDEPRESYSIAWTLLVFMASLLLLRFLMPGLVEEVHYAIERGKQRAKYDLAEDQLSKVSHTDLSSVSRLVTQRIAPSVVHIDTRRETLSESEGNGSGVVISSDGEILTNHHVIKGAEMVEVTLADDRTYDARVVGIAPSADLALLKIEDVSDLIAVEWGDSAELETGSMVWAFGSPFGLSKSATFGIISAKERRSVDPRSADQEPQIYLQSDATVHAGNSGGPLVNSSGQMVGINTAIIGPNFLGVSFSIPSNRAREVYEGVLKGEKEARGWMGVVLNSPPPGDTGVMIEDFVMPGVSPAKAAGLLTGDVITQWNGEPVYSTAILKRLVAETEVDEVVTLRVRGSQDDTERRVSLRIGARPLQF